MATKNKIVKTRMAASVLVAPIALVPASTCVVEARQIVPPAPLVGGKTQCSGLRAPRRRLLVSLWTLNLAIAASPERKPPAEQARAAAALIRDNPALPTAAALRHLHCWAHLAGGVFDSDVLSAGWALAHIPWSPRTNDLYARSAIRDGGPLPCAAWHRTPRGPAFGPDAAF